MKIATWNVNSINARIDHLKLFIQNNNLDIIMLQELKCINEMFPYKQIEDLGYNCYVNGQKAWNGVAILSKKKLNIINTKIPTFTEDEQSRFLETEIKINKIKKNIKLFCIYLPNGNPIETKKFFYKIEWMKKFNTYINNLLYQNDPVIIGGDFNVIPTDEDVYNPINFKDDACAHPKTREQFRILINSGLTDVGKYFLPGSSNWTYWGYRGGGWEKGNGLRIDHFLTSPEITDQIINISVNRKIRGLEKASDHAPLIIKLRN